jgi:hypothetical protein
MRSTVRAAGAPPWVDAELRMIEGGVFFAAPAVLLQPDSRTGATSAAQARQAPVTLRRVRGELLMPVQTR